MAFGLNIVRVNVCGRDCLRQFVTMFLGACLFLAPGACVDKKNREKGELRSITVRSKTDTSLELMLLKSFGILADVRLLDLYLNSGSPSPQSEMIGSRLSALSIGLQNSTEDALRKVLPLYGQAVQSKVNFQNKGSQFFLSDLMSPAVQAVIGRELKLNDGGVLLSSAEALLSLMISDGHQIRFVSQNKNNIANLFLDGLSFKTVGEIPSVSKPVNADRRERNSGFAVGDVLVFSEKETPSELRHIILWIDHDVYLEAVPTTKSLVFRFASYSQVVQELAARTQLDMRQMRMIIVRKNVGWPDVIARMKQFRDQRGLASAQIIPDVSGRGVASAVEGMTLTPVLEQRPTQP